MKKIELPEIDIEKALSSYFAYASVSCLLVVMLQISYMASKVNEVVPEVMISNENIFGITILCFVLLPASIALIQNVFDYIQDRFI